MGISTKNGLVNSEVYEFWRTQISDLNAATSFPESHLVETASADRQSITSISDIFWSSLDDPEALLYAAWCLLAVQYTGCDENIFGRVVEHGRVIPTHLRVEWNATLRQLLDKFRKCLAECRRFENLDLEEIKRLEGGTEFRLNTNLYIVHQGQNEFDLNHLKTPLVIKFAILQDGRIELHAHYDANVIDTKQVKRYLRQLQHIMIQMSTRDSCTPIREFCACGNEDYNEIRDLNSKPSECDYIDECIYERFEKHASAQPDAEAICSWDRNFTYRELDITSARVANELSHEYHVAPEVVVPICFNKSSLAIVAMLAVLRAGGAYTAIDPSHPQNRISEIVQKTKAKTVITSPEHFSLFKGLVEQVIVLTNSYIENLPLGVLSILHPARSHNMAVVQFTSGSTGNPKGIVLEHRSLCKSFQRNGEATNLSQGVRVLQLAAYTFDISVSEIMETLFHGGVVCVPSDEDRMNNLTATAARHRVQSCWMTPSLARLLDPSEIPTLHSLTLGGEAVPSEVFNKWTHHIRHLFVSYGPAECSIYTSISERPLHTDMIGDPCGCSLWIVNPSNYNILAPYGCIGELLIEGPIVGREYLGQPELSKKAFVSNPAWLAESEHARRFYLTGDLVHYDSNGNIRFIGRKDTQVKLRGQRIEMDEIEHHLRVALPDCKQVVSEIIFPRELKAAPNLASFIQLSEETEADKSVFATYVPTTSEWQEKIHGVRNYLLQSLPLYMVPSIFIPLVRIPTNSSWKTDRKRLKELGAGLTVEQLALFGGSRSGTFRAPSTQNEKMLQKLWATVLEINAEAISADDSFLRIGGTSLHAIQLVRLARDQGVSLTVRDIFSQPVLQELAETVAKIQPISQDEPHSAPFCMLRGNIEREAAVKQAALLANVEPAKIQDIFPCSPLQEGLISMTAKRAGEYVSRSVFKLSNEIDPIRFKTACEKLVEMTPILRTRIVDLKSPGLMQVVVDEPLQWFNEYIDSITEEGLAKMGLGTKLSYFGLLKANNDTSNYFVWIIHHALYDGWTLPLMLQNLESIYKGIAPLPETAQFQSFVRYIQNMDMVAADEYWKIQFKDCECSIFPRLPNSTYSPYADSTIEHTITGLGWPSTDVTPAKLVRTTWALLQASYTGSDDVLFGATISGRNAEILGIESIVAPTIATVPIRLVLKNEASVKETQEYVQRHAIEMIPYEQTGLQNIRKASERTSEFQTLLIVQPNRTTPKQNQFLFDKAGDDITTNGFINEVKTYALVLQCYVEEEGLHITVLYDSTILKDAFVERLVNQFDHVLHQICSGIHTRTLIRDVEVTSERDIQRIWGWNADTPLKVDLCVHDLITATAMSQPDSVAISAWNGELTYRQLHEMSSKLAHRLVGLGVGPDVIVPLCFEKSMWTPVAQLAVMKAGGASVMLDMSLPVSRIQSIISQIGNFPVVISSADHKDRASTLSKTNVIVVNSQSMSVLQHQENCGAMSPKLPFVDPSNLLYVVFTSGSTGTPKGVCITHSNVASASYHQREFMKYDAPARVYDFSSYAFDISWSNFLYTFICGGCLCIPLDDDRKNDLSGSINRLNANIISITPSASRILKPSSVPTLKTVNLVGEKEELQDFHRWQNSVYLKCGYGPSECTPISTGILANHDPDPVGLIGRGMALNTWVVDVNGCRLAPPGVIGELWLEGPAVGPGYLNDKQKTAMSFINDPKWLLNGAPGFPGRRGRLYKTGDLVRYREDGTLAFVDRKDTQIKIRGQRVEIGDIEYHIQRILANERPDTKVVVEIIKMQDTQVPIVVAFVCPAPTALFSKSVDIKFMVGTMTESLDDQLLKTLPAYMVPKVYAPITSIPTTATGKIDRKRLREIGSSMRIQDLACGDLNDLRNRREPDTLAEKELQSLWSTILELDAKSISADDSFLRLGGDSIQAMRLVNDAREKGLTLTVADVLQFSKLSDMAKRISVETAAEASINTYQDPNPWSLFEEQDENSRSLFLEEIATLLDFPIQKVQDVFPTTAVQTSCAEAAFRSNPQGCYFFYVDIMQNVNRQQIESFVHEIWARLDILRTVFISYKGELLQVVPRDLPTPLEVHEMTDGQDLNELQKIIFDECLKVPVKIGTTYVRFFIFDQPSKFFRLAFRVSHAHFDGVSLETILRCLTAHLQRLNMPHVAQFSGYIRHVQQNEEKTMKYWRDILEGSSPLSLEATGHDSKVISISKTIPTPNNRSGYTSANVYFAGCAQTLSQIRHTTDIVMSMVVSARAELPSGLDGVFGPCINQIPLRVKLCSDLDFDKTLSAMQKAQIDSTRMELATIGNIYKKCATDWPESQRKLTYTIQFQNVGLPAVDLFGNGEQTSLGFYGSPSVWEHSEDIFIMAIPIEGSWIITISGNASHCTQEHLQNVLDTLTSTLLAV